MEHPSNLLILLELDEKQPGGSASVGVSGVTLFVSVQTQRVFGWTLVRLGAVKGSGRRIPGAGPGGRRPLNEKSAAEPRRLRVPAVRAFGSPRGSTRKGRRPAAPDRLPKRR